MDNTYVVISDTQTPFEDTRAMKAVIRFIGEFQPSEVVHIGDVMDLPQPSRWNKDTRGEFEGSVFRDAEYTVKNLIAPLREVYAGDIGMLEGNHDLRARDYLSKYAPALSESRAFHMETLLEFEDYEIRRLPDFYKFTPGWVFTHGHLAGIRITGIAGNTAVNAAKKLGTSVVMGHTHRLGVVSHSTGLTGSQKIVTGFEVGNLMDPKKATYLKGFAGNWQQGFGIVRVDGTHVKAEAVPIANKKFIVDGVTYNV